jgi:PhoH-like ATPase
MEEFPYMSNTITIDTNLLLDDAKIIYKLSKEYDRILIPRTVLKELDKHKYNPNLSYSARNAIASIRQFKEEKPDRLIFFTQGGEIDNNDSWIIEASKHHNADLATKDISMSIIAEAEGLNCKLYDVVLNNIFNPYYYITIEEIYENDEIDQLERFYSKEAYNKIIYNLSSILNKKLSVDSWFFVFVKAEDDIYVYANNPIKNFFIRIDHHSQYREMKCDNGTIIKARDVYQNCAIYALREAPNVLLTGKWGSGKSLLSCAYTLESKTKKAFISRPPVGINAKYEIGFLPGDKYDKMMDWLGGFTSALYYVYGNTNGQSSGRSNDYNYVKDEVFDKKFEVLPLNSIQGLSLLQDDVLLVDEIQLISVDYMSMILSRPSEGGKLIMMGDLKQTYNIVKPSESGLLKLLRILPHHTMAFINLEYSYRSDVIQLADKLQDKTIE